jgi:hypothetical protein
MGFDVPVARAPLIFKVGAANTSFREKVSGQIITENVKTKVSIILTAFRM